MKQRKIMWMLGTILAASLLTTGPALAAAKSAKARIPDAKRHHVTQISDRDVVLSQNPRTRGGRLMRLTTFENGRQALAPNPDAQRQVVVPNPDAQRQVVVPNPDAQRQVVVPNPDAQRQVVVPNPSAE